MYRLAPRPIAFLSVAAFGVAGLCTRAAGQATTESSPPTAADLQRQIELLQSQVQALEAKQLESKQLEAKQPAATDLDDVKEHDETVDRVLADAKQRSQMLNGVNAGWDKGRFYVASADRNFVIKPWVQFQFRYGTAYRDAGKPSGADDVQSGFEIRRLRLGIDGNLFTPQLTYFFNFGTYRANTTGNLPGGGSIGLGNAGSPELEEAWLKYQFTDTPWAVRAGQFHDPLDHEAIISSRYRGAEAALSTDIFANEETYVKGVTAIYDPKADWRFEGGFTDGIRSTDTNFEDYPNEGNGFDFGLAGRLEYKVMGNWADYGQLTAYGDTKELLVIGAAFDESQAGNSDTFSHTIDVQYANPQGLLLYGSYFGRYTSDNRGIPLATFTGDPISPAGTPGEDTYEYALLGQAAYLIRGKYEPYVRYEYMHLAGTPTGSNDEVHALSAGMNYYLYGHNAKLTGQVMYLPNGIPIADVGNDVLVSNNHGEVVFIVQFQLML